MKTIKELNEKIWYRFLKVIYIFVLLIVLLLTNIFEFADFKDGIKTPDNSKTKITCAYKDKKEFTPQDAGIDLKSLSENIFDNGIFEYKNLFDGYNQTEITKILDKCYNTTIQKSGFIPDDVYVLQRIYEVIKASPDYQNHTIHATDAEKATLDNDLSKIDQAYGSDKVKYLDFSIKLFDIKPEFTYVPFIQIFTLMNLSILALFELFKRIFYYIILGTVRPKKR